MYLEKISFTINKIAISIGSVLLSILTIWTVCDVVGRTFFNKPISGTLEMTELILVAIAYFSFGYVEHFNQHIVIDVAYEAMPKPVKAVVLVFANLVTLVIAVMLSWRLYVFSTRMTAGNYTTATLHIPIGVVVFMAAIGAACYALAMLSSLLKALRKLGEKEGRS